MVEILKRVEQIPAAYPAKPGNLSDEADALDAGLIWGRIESYTAHRFSVREVVWTVEGPGDWVPDLTPVTISAIEFWEQGNWFEAFPVSNPLGGYELCVEGPYRITATAGGGDAPAAILEAYKRLAEYSAGERGAAGASSQVVSVGPITDEVRRNPAWLARAVQNCGAGDLLRPYRRA